MQHFSLLNLGAFKFVLLAMQAFLLIKIFALTCKLFYEKLFKYFGSRQTQSSCEYALNILLYISVFLHPHLSFRWRLAYSWISCRVLFKLSSCRYVLGTSSLCKYSWQRSAFNRPPPLIWPTWYSRLNLLSRKGLCLAVDFQKLMKIMKVSYYIHNHPYLLY